MKFKTLTRPQIPQKRQRGATFWGFWDFWGGFVSNFRNSLVRCSVPLGQCAAVISSPVRLSVETGREARWLAVHE